MAQDSTALSRFPSRTIGETALVMLAFAFGLQIAPAVAHDPVALIETLTSPTQLEVIRLTPDQTMVLSYRDSCVHEIITGGVVKIGRQQSDVQSGEVERTRENCAKGNVEVTGGEASGKPLRSVGASTSPRI
jgi:hypothetical protein